MARLAAMTARPVAVSTGAKLSSAQTVQGREKENPSTPRSASDNPRRSCTDVTGAPYSRHAWTD